MCQRLQIICADEASWAERMGSLSGPSEIEGTTLHCAGPSKRLDLPRQQGELICGQGTGDIKTATAGPQISESPPSSEAGKAAAAISVAVVAERDAGGKTASEQKEDKNAVIGPLTDAAAARQTKLGGGPASASGSSTGSLTGSMMQN